MIFCFSSDDRYLSVHHYNIESDLCKDNTIDVAVVGAGVSGVYSAYKLSQHTDLSIHVYETEDRVGGRTFSVPMPGISDFKADIGAMRFQKNSHKRLFSLAKELGLTIIPFTTQSENNTLYFLRDRTLDMDDIKHGENLPYDMTPGEKRNAYNIKALHA